MVSLDKEREACLQIEQEYLWLEAKAGFLKLITWLKRLQAMQIKFMPIHKASGGRIHDYSVRRRCSISY